MITYVAFSGSRRLELVDKSEVTRAALRDFERAKFLVEFAKVCTKSKNKKLRQCAELALKGWYGYAKRQK